MISVHANIQDSELRLLRPVFTTYHRLEFQLLVFQRPSCPSYTAVSYTWGTAPSTETIHLNGCEFKVSTDLWSCLYYLSLDEKHQAWDYLWVDALCIDQSNDTERNTQVRRMDETYRCAACVSVWLGLIPLPDAYGSNQPIKTFDSDGFDFCDSMDDLANRPYWSRFWVIQEFLLCQMVTLYCSGNSIDWLLFQELLERHAGIRGTGFDLYNAAEERRARSIPAFPLVMSRHPDRFPELPQPFHNLLVNHSQAQCKDPRDRVFALLGLVTQDERILLERYVPDYTLSHDNVVVVALGHLTDVDRKKLTADSDDVFEGLGVRSRARRLKLLRRLEHFDYLGFEGDTSYLRLLETEDDRRAIEGETMAETMTEENRIDDGIVFDGADAVEKRRWCTGKKRLLGCLLLGIVVWIYTKQ